MSKFLKGERVAVFLESDPDNRVYIKPKMDFGTRNRVMGEALHVAPSQNGTAGQAQDLNIGAMNNALIVHNVVAWEGPDFQDEDGRLIPCDEANMLSWDPDDPLLDRVLAEINARNTNGVSSPNSKRSPAVGKTGSKGRAAKTSQ